MLVRYKKYDPSKKEWITDQVGEFLIWGLDCEEFTNGVGNYSVAIVKTLDDRVELVPPGNIEKLID